MAYTSIPASYISAVAIPRAFGQLVKDDLDDHQARLLTLESGAPTASVRAKYVQTTLGQAVGSSVDTQVQFPVAVKTSPQVTPGGTNNSYFDLGIGAWLCIASARISNGAAWQGSFATGTTFNVANAFGGGGAGVFNGCVVGQIDVTSGTTRVHFNLYQAGAATNISTGFGGINAIAFLRLGNP